MSSSNNNRLSGINPLSYMGVNPYTPVPLFIRDRAPNVNDYQNFALGTLWLVSANHITEEVWILVNLEAGVATWVQLYPGSGGGGTSTFNCDSGAANESGGAISIVGGNNVTTAGSGSSVTISVDLDVADEYQADSGSAAPSGGIIRILGGDNISTTASGNEITANLGSNISVPGSIDAGGNLNISGSSVFGGNAIFLADAIFSGDISVPGNLSVAGSSNFSGDAVFSSGVQISSLGEGAVISDSSGHLSSINGSNGELLIGRTGSTPIWNSLTSNDGSIVITNGSGTIDLSAVGGGGGGGSSVAFLGYQISDQAYSFTPPPQTYSMGSLSALGVLVNQGSAFFPGNGSGMPAVFTAPSTGQYYLQFFVEFDAGSVTSFNGQVFSINTPSNSYTTTTGRRPGSNGTTWTRDIFNVSAISTLTEGDEVTFSITGSDNNNPSLTHTIAGASGSALKTWVCGYRVEGGGASSALASFQAYQTNNLLIMDGTTNVYSLGSSQAMTKVFDETNNFYVGDGVGTPAAFTAPRAGLYFFQMSAYVFASPSTGFDQLSGAIQTPAISFFTRETSGSGPDLNQHCVISTSIATRLNASDEVKFNLFRASGSSSGYNLQGGTSAGFYYTYTSGYQIR